MSTTDTPAETIPVQPTDAAFSTLKPEIASLKTTAGVEKIQPKSQKVYPIGFLLQLFLTEAQSRIDTPAMSLTVRIPFEYPHVPAQFALEAPFPSAITGRLKEHLNFHASQASESKQSHVHETIQWFVNKVEDILMTEFRDALESYLADLPDGSQQRRFAVQTDAVIVAPEPLLIPQKTKPVGAAKSKPSKPKESKKPPTTTPSVSENAVIQKKEQAQEPSFPQNEGRVSSSYLEAPAEANTNPPSVDTLTAESRSARDDEFVQCMKRFGSGLVFEKSTRRQDLIGEDYHFFVLLSPSDPDFSFEFVSIKIHIILPHLYPGAEDPIVKVVDENLSPIVRNEINEKIIERIKDARSTTGNSLRLRRLFTWLDNNLNELLQNAYANEIKARELEAATAALSIEVNPNSEESGDGSDESGEDYEGHSEDNEDYDEDDYDSDELPENENHNPSTPEQPKTGIPVLLVNLALEGISIIQCLILNIQVICSRCQSKYDISLSGTSSQTKLFQCGKCHYAASARFLPKLAHIRDPCIGNIDQLYNMSVFDVLPSTFRASCMECPKISIKVPDMLAGRHFSRVCHECHKTMSFSYEKSTLGVIKSQLTGETLNPENEKASAPRRKIPKDSSLKVGTPLPKNGACKHYAQSFRWLRFPCCGKAYPCDDCHNEESDHIAEWATRMICGNCSRETSYYANKICSCGQPFGRVTSKSHWEGGQGCRDRSKMSRKDPKKYSGYGKTQSRRSIKPK